MGMIIEGECAYYHYIHIMIYKTNIANNDTFETLTISCLFYVIEFPKLF